MMMKDTTEEKMKAQFIEITPDDAREMLEANIDNRKVSRAHVATLSRDIANDRWQFNGDPIRFDADGVLLDGQHRLMAVIEANKPIQSLVIRGLPNASKVTIDTGARRTVGDFFQFRGIADANSVASACRYAMIARHKSTHSRSYSHSEVWEFFNEHPGIKDDVKKMRGVTCGLSGICAAVSYIGSLSASAELIDEWQTVWLEGFGERGHPCLTMRTLIYDATLSGKPMHPMTKMRLVSWSMVKLMRGETVTIARIPESVSLPGWTDRQ